MKEMKITIRKTGSPEYVYYSSWFPQAGNTVNFKSFAGISGEVTDITWTHTNKVIVTVS